MSGRFYKIILIAFMVPLVLLCGCEGSEVDSEGEAVIGGPTAFLLPPGHPGTASGSTLVIPAEPDPPSIRTANCFAGVENTGNIGIGSVVGVTDQVVGTAVLPVNVNLGSAELLSYKFTVHIADPSVAFDAPNTRGSNWRLSTGDCYDRQCPSMCASYPTLYPNQFNPAPGFEGFPTATLTGNTLEVEALNSDTATPTTGIVNIANIKINVISALPANSHVVLDFTVTELKDESGADIAFTQTPDGVVIENFNLQ